MHALPWLHIQFSDTRSGHVNQNFPGEHNLYALETTPNVMLQPYTCTSYT